MNDGFAENLTGELRQFLENRGTTFPPALLQVANVASLPGIVMASIGLPDIHSGYGFAIGTRRIVREYRSMWAFVIACREHGGI